MEWLWSDMKAFIRNKFPTNFEELKNAANEYRKTITPRKCTNYIKRLKKVIQIVIEKNGEWSNF